MTELLAPAGGPEQLIAALHAGEDAVYLGYQSFSARAGARNFDEEQLREAASLTGIFGARCYLACNTLYTDREREELISLIRLAASLGIDGVILQDLGLCRLLRQMVPEMKLHASTQLSVHTKEGANQLKELGFSRVVLARELSLSEIANILPAAIETEVFVHGSLCFSLSGQCYLSGFLGGRSANRGRCAQPCRLPFSVQRNGAADLSMKDLCAADSVAELCRLGVTSLKIEGRMKRPEYVAAATAAYRAILDGNTPDLESLRKVFSRSGFTNGYLTGHPDGNMFGQRQKEDAAAPSLLRELKNRYRKPIHRVALTGCCRLIPGKSATLTLSDGQHQITVTGAPVEQASQTPLREDSVRRLLGKLEETPFYWEYLQIDIEGSPYLPAAAINRLRREAVEELTAGRGDRKPFNVSCLSPPVGGDAPKRRSPALRARFRSVDQIADPSLYQWIYLPVNEILKEPERIAPFQSKVIATLPSIRFGIEPQLLETLKTVRELGITHLLASNVADFGLKREFTLHGDYTLHPTNSDVLQLFAQLGLSDAILSVELRKEAIRDLSSPIPCGIIIYGKLPLTISRNCPVKAKIGCQKCNRRLALTDRLGKTFPVRCQAGYCEIFNSVPLSLLDLPWRKHSSFGCLYFTEESPGEVEQISRQATASSKITGEYTRGFYHKDHF